MPAGDSKRDLRSFLASFVAVCLALVIIYSTGFGLFYPIEQRGGIYVASIFIVLFKMGSDLGRQSDRKLFPTLSMCFDFILLIASIFAVYRFTVVQRLMADDLYDILNVDIVACFCGFFVILELTRRVWGWTLFWVTFLSLAYIFWGQDLPGVLRHTGFSLDQIAENLWFNLNKGVFGSITNIVINVVLIFVLFGVLLENTGAGETLLKYAFRLTRKTRGGPAIRAVYCLPEDSFTYSHQQGHLTPPVEIPC